VPGLYHPQPAPAGQHQLDACIVAACLVADQGEARRAVAVDSGRRDGWTLLLQSALPPVELALPQLPLPAEGPRRHAAPRSIPNDRLPVPRFLYIVFWVHCWSSRARARTSSAHVQPHMGVWPLTSEHGRWVYRTGTVFVPPNQFRRHLDDIFGHQPVLFGAIASGRAAGFQVLAVSLPASMREAVMRRLSEAL